MVDCDRYGLKIQFEVSLLLGDEYCCIQNPYN